MLSTVENERTSPAIVRLDIVTKEHVRLCTTVVCACRRLSSRRQTVSYEKQLERRYIRY